ncbi:MAG: serine hydrolase, partial [Pseudomonadota bacterium]
GVQACINWIGCSEDMVNRAVALYRHTDEPARDYPGDLPPNCSIPLAEGEECTLANYVPGTNASVFSPQGGVRIGMLDVAEIGRQIMIADQGDFLSDAALKRFGKSLVVGQNFDQDFFCTYGLGVQLINMPNRACLDMLFGGETMYIGHSGEAYGLQSGLWFAQNGKSGLAFFRTQAPPPAGGEDTGGFTQGEKDLMKRAQEALAKQASE